MQLRARELLAAVRVRDVLAVAVDHDRLVDRDLAAVNALLHVGAQAEQGAHLPDPGGMDLVHLARGPVRLEDLDDLRVREPERDELLDHGGPVHRREGLAAGVLAHVEEDPVLRGHLRRDLDLDRERALEIAVAVQEVQALELALHVGIAHVRVDPVDRVYAPVAGHEDGAAVRIALADHRVHLPMEHRAVPRAGLRLAEDVERELAHFALVVTLEAAVARGVAHDAVDIEHLIGGLAEGLVIGVEIRVLGGHGGLSERLCLAGRLSLCGAASSVLSM